MKQTTFVTCPICGKQLSSLSTKHLKSHDLTVKLLRGKYPDVIIHSDVFLENKKLMDANYRKKNKDS